MHPRGPDESRLGAAEHRPPSARSRDALADGLRQEVAEARVRLEEAGLRAETHRLLGNHEAAVDATREQEEILADVEARLGRVVSSAVVQRDAEQVLADATGHPGDLPVHAQDPREVRPRAPVLAGVASVLAVVAVSTAAVLGVAGGLDRVEVVGAAGDLEAQEQTSSPSPDDTPTRPAPPAQAPRAAVTDDGTTADSSLDAAPTDAVAAPETGRTTPSTPPTGETTVADESDDGSDLDQAVTELLDAVGGLEQEPDESEEPDPSESDSETPSVDADMSGEDLGELVDEVAPDATGGMQDGTGDGFVPAPSAQ